MSDPEKALWEYKQTLSTKGSRDRTQKSKYAEGWDRIFGSKDKDKSNEKARD